MDPRFYQIGFLVFFLGFGVLFKDFQIGWSQVAVAFVGGIAAQWVAFCRFKLPRSSFRSAAITVLGLLILLRTQSLFGLLFASILAISSKFVFRYQGKHFFNPANFALAVMILFTSTSWISPAQWGEGVVMAGWISLLGIMVSHKALRSDISFAFLGWYLLFLFLRVVYLGQPWDVFFHQLKSGSLILFSFFMISDPKSTPNHRTGRILFSALVAALAYFIKFHLYNPNALVLALFFLSPLIPVIDNLYLANRFEWQTGERSQKQYEGHYQHLLELFSSQRLGFLRFLRR